MKPRSRTTLIVNHQRAQRARSLSGNFNLPTFEDKSGDVLHSGNLIMERLNKKFYQKAFKSRFVVLYKDCIQAFSDEQTFQKVGEKPSVIIELSKHSSVTDVDTYKNHNHAFGIHIPGLNITQWFVAENEDQRKAWIKSINKAIAKLKEGRLVLTKKDIEMAEKDETTADLVKLISIYELNPNARVLNNTLMTKEDFSELGVSPKQNEIRIETPEISNVDYPHKSTLLHIACESGNVKLVKKLLISNNKSNPNLVNVNGETAVHALCRCKKNVEVIKEIVDVLIENGADLNIRDKEGFTATCRACSLELWDLADATLYHTDINLASKKGSPLHFAVKFKHYKTIRALLLRNASLDIKDDEEKTPLDIAILNKDITSIEKNPKIETTSQYAKYYLPYLIELGKEDLFLEIIKNQPDLVNYEFQNKEYKIEKCSLLAKTIQHDAWKLTKILLDNKADVNSELIQMVENPKTNKVEEHTYAPIHLAIIKGNTEMINALLNSGADCTKQTKPEGLSALFLAARCNVDENTLESIIQSNGVDLHQTNEKGANVFYYAAQSNNIQLLKKLIEKEVDPRAITHLGMNALSSACEAGALDVVKYLIEELEFDIRGTGKEQFITDSYPPIHSAALNGKEQVVAYLLKKGKEQELDLANWGSDGQMRPIHLACMHGHTNVVKLLVEYGADYKQTINTSEDKKINALHLAVGYGNTEIIDFLIQSGADLEIKSEKGFTALHYALKRFQFEAVKLLCEKGAASDDIALQFAIQTGKHEVFEWVQKNKKTGTL